MCTQWHANMGTKLLGYSCSSCQLGKCLLYCCYCKDSRLVIKKHWLCAQVSSSRSWCPSSYGATCWFWCSKQSQLKVIFIETKQMSLWSETGRIQLVWKTQLWTSGLWLHSKQHWPVCFLWTEVNCSYICGLHYLGRHTWLNQCTNHHISWGR